MDLPETELVVRGSTDVGGVHLAWRRSGPRGESPAVVLAHGLTDSAECWGRTAQLLAQHHDVIAYDARGHGGSSRADDYGAEAGARDLVGLVRALRLERPVIVGHSMGAVVAVLAARQIEAAALVSEDPAWDAPTDGSKDIAASRRRVTEIVTASEVDRLAHGRARHPGWSRDDLAAWSAAQLQVDPDVVDWFGSWRTISRWREHVRGQTCPGLLLIGDSGAVTPSAAAEAQGLWPRLQVAQVHGAGHDVHRDRPEAFWQELHGFLSTVGP